MRSNIPTPPHHVNRSEVLDYKTYEENRDEKRKQILAIKRLRRIHLGNYLTLLFENHDTILYQIQEMIRVEKIVRESDIQEQIDTYNALLGKPGQLGCTLLIEITEENQRQLLLTEWNGLQKQIFARLPNDKKIYAEYDSAQTDGRRLSAVQYLTFEVDEAPTALGCDFPGMRETIELDTNLKTSLTEDLKKTLI
tara:strand:- start:69 stop:653 length:585 start_codon:yes stop_codon:yes gene_type:complete